MNNFIESLESKKLSKHFNNLSDYEKGKNEGLNAAIEIFKNLHPENEIVKPIQSNTEYLFQSRVQSFGQKMLAILPVYGISQTLKREYFCVYKVGRMK